VQNRSAPLPHTLRVLMMTGKAKGSRYCLELPQESRHQIEQHNKPGCTSTLATLPGKDLSGPSKSFELPNLAESPPTKLVRRLMVYLLLSFAFAFCQRTWCGVLLIFEYVPVRAETSPRNGVSDCCRQSARVVSCTVCDVLQSESRR